MKLAIFVCLALALCVAAHDDLSAREHHRVTTSIDLNVQQNAATSKTEKYRTDNLVVRRGGSFEITVGGGAPVSTIELVLVGGKSEKISLKVGAPAFQGFSANKHKSDPSRYVIVVPADAPIGEFTVVAGSAKSSKSVIIIFNPYNPGDSVACVRDPKNKWKQCDLKEHVEAESGFIWVGSSDNNGPRGWNYDQFNFKALQTALKAISPLSLKDRANPVIVARRLSDIMNTERAGDGGILEGNWSGKYTGGKEPGFWTGSIAVFDEFLKTGKPTKFGQCWVFAGCTNTLGRTLGMPTRVVTTFDSAHECKRGGKFDQVVEEYWKSAPNNMWTREEGKSCDSIWNFHVWNEGFFTRPDLSGGDYGGWQAFDGTPQEESEGKYQTGPASVKSCFDKKVDAKYDVDFVAGETDADVKRYVDGKLYHTDTLHVGAKIYTKAVNSNSFLNLAADYKQNVGSPRFAATTDVTTAEGVSFSLFVPKSTKSVGESFYVHLGYAKSGDKAPRKLTIAIQAEMIDARGKVIAPIRSHSETVEPTEKQGKVILEIKAADYVKHLKTSSSFSFAFFAAAEGKTIYADRAQITLKTPSLNMLGQNQLRLGNKVSVPVKFTNPLDEELEVLSINYALTGVDVENDKLSGIFGSPTAFTGKLGPREAKMWHLSAQASTLGEVLIVATLQTDKLADVNGFKELVVLPRLTSAGKENADKDGKARNKDGA